MKKSLVIIFLLLALAVHVSDVTAQGWTFENGWKDPNGYSCFGGRCWWTDETWSKWEKMRTLGFSDSLATDIINGCKKRAKDPNHCVRTATFIAVAESTAGNNVTKSNNVFWIEKGKFDSKKDSVDDWITRYNRKWYKTTWPIDFYSPKKWVKPKTKYCIREGRKNHCPNWYRNATIATEAFDKPLPSRTFGE